MDLDAIYPLLHTRAPVADLVWASDWGSGDPGSNPNDFFHCIYLIIKRSHEQLDTRANEDTCYSMCNRTWERGTWQTHWSLLLIIPGVWHSSSKLATAMTLPALPTHISPLTRCRLTQLASGASIQLHCKGSMWLLWMVTNIYTQG